MTEFIDFINKPATPLFTILAAGFAGFAFVGFAFLYNWYETRKSNESKKGI
jgi:uncharacterized protein involved in exopolysaccharide biosynthesis